MILLSCLYRFASLLVLAILFRLSCGQYWHRSTHCSLNLVPRVSLRTALGMRLHITLGYEGDLLITRQLSKHVRKQLFCSLGYSLFPVHMHNYLVQCKMCHLKCKWIMFPGDCWICWCPRPSKHAWVWSSFIYLCFFLITRQSFLQTMLSLWQVRFRIKGSALKFCGVCFIAWRVNYLLEVSNASLYLFKYYLLVTFEAFHLINFESYFNCLDDLKKPFYLHTLHV